MHSVSATIAQIIESISVDGLLLQGFLAVVVLAFCTFLVPLLKLVLNRLGRGLTRRHGGGFGEQLLQTVSGPVSLLLYFQGPFLATTVIGPVEPWRSYLFNGWKIVLIGLLAIILARVVTYLFDWYGQSEGNSTRVILDRRLVPALRRFMVLGLYLLAGMLVLDQLGISITPLVAGLGIGGLAVALALQPTLSNFFAGTYLVSDAVIVPGEFIQLENGFQGFVVDVGWRSTRIRTAFNNLVVIPNARLADTILTNYDAPSQNIGVLVEGGVSYSSDLTHVERVSKEVARQIIQELPEAVSSFDPWFGYEKFGDSNIDFWVWVEAKDRGGSFALKTELIKRLHKRFNDEGIEINYPVRKLIFPLDGENNDQ